MASQAETMTEIDVLTDVLQEVAARREMGAKDLEGLRRALHGPGALGEKEAGTIIEAHAVMPATDNLWIEFLVEALSEFFIGRKGRDIGMDEAREDLALAFLGRTTPMTDPGRRRLALRLFLRVTRASDRFRRLVLDMAHHHLLHDKRRLLIDQKRTPGVIDLVDLQLLRKLVFGAGGQYADQVVPITASFLLELDRAPFSFVEPKAWKRLFLQALSLCLLRDQEGEGGAGTTIDETAAALLTQSIEAGGTGANTFALIELLSSKTSGLPPALEALCAKK